MNTSKRAEKRTRRHSERSSHGNSPACGSAARPRRRRKIVSRTLFFVLIAIFVIISLFPFYWILITSLKTQADISKGTTSLLPEHINFGSYKIEFTQTSSTGVNFGRALLNSAIVAPSATVIAVILGSLAGYALAHTRLRGRPVILGFILIAGFFPLIAIVGPMFLTYRRIGLLDTYPGLIISYLVYTLPIAVWLLTNYFSQIPTALEEAAIVDGATRLQALRRVIVPVALPGVFTATIISFILGWNDFLFALMFMTSPSTSLLRSRSSTSGRASTRCSIIVSTRQSLPSPSQSHSS